jgi:hypothetical protein
MITPEELKLVNKPKASIKGSQDRQGRIPYRSRGLTSASLLESYQEEHFYGILRSDDEKVDFAKDKKTVRPNIGKGYYCAAYCPFRDCGPLSPQVTVKRCCG